MAIYELPKFESGKLKVLKFWPERIFILLLILLISFVFGGLGGLIAGSYLLKLKEESPELKKIEKETVREREPVYLPETSQEEAIIKVVKEVSPAVVSIVITKDVPKLELYYENPFKDFEEFFWPSPFEFKIPQYRQKGTEKKEIGGGTGFIISEDGMILTNKHVVLDKEADYTVLTNDGRKFAAKVLARDPVQDLAIIKIEKINGLIPAKIGDSDKLEIGQTVITIGNVLGEFRNSVSMGIISGLGRTVTASGGGLIETLEDVIQTDAAINKGNSGGPLLNLKGEVIGINTAMALGAENVGFAIPINKAKKDIEQVKKFGKIVYPFLGVRYILINEIIQKENDLPVNYGAWVVRDKSGEPAIFPGSAAEKAGLKERDIILEFNKEKISNENTLAKIIMKYNPGDKVILKILRNGQEKNLEVILGEKID